MADVDTGYVTRRPADVALAQVRPYTRIEHGRPQRVGSYVTSRGAHVPDEHGWIPPEAWARGQASWTMRGREAWAKGQAEGQKLWEERGREIWERNEWVRRARTQHITHDIHVRQAHEVRPGDRILVRHPDTGRLRPSWVDHVEPASPGKVRVRVRHHPEGHAPEHAARAPSEHLFHAGDLVHVVHPDVSDQELHGLPDEADIRQDLLPRQKIEKLPPETPVARPALHTYQRQMITDLGLDDLAGTLHPLAQQAAARIRARQPLSEEHLDRLALALHARANELGIKRPRQRALRRIVDRLNAAGAEARGASAPFKGEAGHMARKVRAADLTEGDHFAWRDFNGQMATGELGSVTRSMGGRVLEADVRLPDGSTERHLFTGRTTTYLLPDKPPDKPLPPPGGSVREHVAPEHVQPGDVINTPDGQAEVTAVRPLSLSHVDADVRYPDGSTGIEELFTGDGGPTVIRVKRGAASASQPWNMTLPEENPETIAPGDVRPGDRIEYHVPGGAHRETATILKVSRGRAVGKIKTARLDMRLDDGTAHFINVALPQDSSLVINRLSHSPENLAHLLATIGGLKRTGQVNEVFTAMRATHRDIMDKLVTRARSAIPPATMDPGIYSPLDSLSPRLAESVLGHLGASLASTISQTTNETFERQGHGIEQLADNLARIASGAPGPPSGPLTEEFRQRLTDFQAELAALTRGQMAESLRNVHPLPGESAVNAVLRTLEASREFSPLTGTAARTLRDAVAQLSARMDEARPSLPEIPQLRLGGNDVAAPEDVKAFADRMMAALPEQQNIGKSYVERSMITPPTLAALQRGEAPAITRQRMWAKDVAADGGPGHMAMHHNEVMRTLGRELSGELALRISARMEKENVFDRLPAARAAQEKLQADINKNILAGMQTAEAAREAKARELGYASNTEHSMRQDLAVREVRRLTLLLKSAGLTPEQKDELKQADDLLARLREHGEDIHQAGKEATQSDTARLQELGALRQKLYDAKVEQLQLEHAEHTFRRDEAVRLLQEARGEQFGGRELNYQVSVEPNGSMDVQQTLDAMRFAETNYPKSWLDLASKQGSGRYELKGGVARGSYTHAYRKIELSGGESQKVSGAGKSGQVATHELGHAMEQAVAGLLHMQEAEIWRRAASGEIGSRQMEELTHLGASYDSWEKAYFDQFPEPYSGKAYDGGRSWELFTTGIESLMAGSPYLDAQFQHWLLGVLVALGRAEGYTGSSEAEVQKAEHGTK